MPMYLGPAMFNLMRSLRLLNALEKFIGPVVIAVNPLQFTRIEPPERLLSKDVQEHPNGMISRITGTKISGRLNMKLTTLMLSPSGSQ